MRLRTALIVLVALLAGFASLPDAPADSGDPTASFTFSAAGDMGYSPNADATLIALAGSGSAFHLHLGDMGYDQIAPESAWCDFVKNRVGDSFPYQLVAGGHDLPNLNPGHGWIDKYAVCLPDHMNSTGTYAKEYVFDYPAAKPLARVIMVSPQMPFPEGKYDYSAGTPRYQWVSDTIDAARASGIRWVVVGMAWNCVSAGEKWCEIGTDLFTLLMDKRVDLILQGHEHGYERSKQLATGPGCKNIPLNAPAGLACTADDGADNVYTKGKGPIVVVAGTAGIPLRLMNVNDPEASDFVKLMGRDLEATYGFMRFDVTPTRISGRFVRTFKGNFADDFVIAAEGAPPITMTTQPPTTVITAPFGTLGTPAYVSGQSGYWLVGTGGRVYPFGDAPAMGEPVGLLAPGATAVDIEASKSGRGYWIADSNGAVFAYGDAPALDGLDPRILEPGETVTSLSRTATGRGYWLFTTRGRVVPFGDATFLGDVSSLKLNAAVLDSIPTPSGRGYYLVAGDGGIFAFGDAIFLGSMGDKKLNAPVQSLVPDPDWHGYWLVASDGGVFAFEADFHGSMGDTRLNQPITGMVPYSEGYLMVANDGGVFNFSDKPYTGSLGDHPPDQPITAVTALP